MTEETGRRPRLFDPAYAATTVGVVALVGLVAFEATAVTTVMPTVARLLDGVALYALAFAAPLASGVVGMVAAGGWSDRRGPVLPLVTALVVFAGGLVVCGLAPTMPVLVAGRLVQGLGGGAAIVSLYVVVGVAFPESLRPAIFAAFAAAWVLPTLFGPSIAAGVAHAVGWRWVFLGTVALVAAAAALLLPVLRTHPDRGGDPGPFPRAAVGWAVFGASAVVVLELAGSGRGWRLGAASLALVAGVVALHRLLPAGALRAARGLPAVIATRGLMSGAFVCAESYVVYVLQERWGLSAALGGLALTGVGLAWAGASQVQAWLATRVGDAGAMTAGGVLLLAGTAALAGGVAAHVSPVLAMAAYVVAGAGMGFGYPRTNVAVLAASTDADRGANSAALSVADSLGAAMAVSVAGAGFTLAGRAGGDPFLVVFVLAAALAGLAAVAAVRTRPQRPADRGRAADCSSASSRRSRSRARE